MGLDLQLLPFESDYPGNTFSHTVLRLHSSRELWSEIEKLPSFTVPNDFHSLVSTESEGEDKSYGITTQTPYGEELRWTQASELTVFRNHPEVKRSHRNCAAWAYLSCLPPETKIALYWY